MQNLEQIRAASAIAAAQANVSYSGKEGGGNVAKRIPPLIINYGLLQFLAYADSEGGAERNIADFLAKHLSDVGIIAKCDDTKGLIQALMQGDSQLLKRATAETMAWFNYARRFIK
ncbi:MAG: hypothetical protein CML12_01055 [Puniceicoccaceae bacterium]|nr:hypothetical protein [Puniceicoccaceae bacterium]|tara:strand:- start:339 stop:686 length:348 start_codon:yes stop_codon:yes gene_type:complete